MSDRGVNFDTHRMISELLQRQHMFSDGTIDYEIPGIADKFGVTEEAVRSVFREMLRAANPEHPTFIKAVETLAGSGKARHDNIKKRVQAIIQQGIKQDFKFNEAWNRYVESCNSYLGVKNSRYFTKDRIERIKSAVDFINSSPGGIRYKALSSFVGQYNRERPEPEHISYGQVKGDMYALAYATIAMPDGRPTTARDVPPEHKDDFRRLRTAFSEKDELLRLDKEKCLSASQSFLSSTPEHDLERMLTMYNSGGREVEAMARRFVSIISKIKGMRESLWNTHPARAYSMAWLTAGNKLHSEIPELLDWAWEEHGGSKLPVRDARGQKSLDEFPTLGAYFDSRPEMKSAFTAAARDPGAKAHRGLRQLADGAYKELWHENFLKIQAIWQYEQARIKLGKMIKEHKGTFPDPAIEQHYESMYKTIRRSNDPGKEFRGVPLAHKRSMIREAEKYLRSPKDYKFDPDPKARILQKKLIEVGTHLRAGDKIYSQYKKFREKRPGPHQIRGI